MAVVTLPFPTPGDVSLFLGVKQELQTSVLLLQFCKANTIHTIVGFVYFIVRVVLAAGFALRTALRKQCHGCQEETTPAFINHLIKVIEGQKVTSRRRAFCLWHPRASWSCGMGMHPVSMGMGCSLGVHSSWASCAPAPPATSCQWQRHQIVIFGNLHSLVCKAFLD